MCRQHLLQDCCPDNPEYSHLIFQKIFIEVIPTPTPTPRKINPGRKLRTEKDAPSLKIYLTDGYKSTGARLSLIRNIEAQKLLVVFILKASGSWLLSCQHLQLGTTWAQKRFSAKPPQIKRTGGASSLSK